MTPHTPQLRPPDAYPDRPPAAVPAEVPGTRVVLLVDDDPDCRLLVKDALCEAAAGQRLCVYEVPDGESAMRFLQRRGEFAEVPRPALVYLDIEMPGMGGLETLERIRAERELEDVPVVMFTGLADAGPMRQAARLGANSYLLKPADADRLLQTVLESARYWLAVHQSPHSPEPKGGLRRLPPLWREGRVAG